MALYSEAIDSRPYSLPSVNGEDPAGLGDEVGMLLHRGILKLCIRRTGLTIGQNQPTKLLPFTNCLYSMVGTPQDILPRIILVLFRCLLLSFMRRVSTRKNGALASQVYILKAANLQNFPFCVDRLDSYSCKRNFLFNLNNEFLSTSRCSSFRYNDKIIPEIKFFFLFHQVSFNSSKSSLDRRHSCHASNALHYSKYTYMKHFYNQNTNPKS